MNFLPDFEDDIFISYAHIDNQPLTEGQKGWISSFHQALEIRLAQLLGAEAKIWRDPALRGNEYVGDKLTGQISKIAVLVSVVSPRYINSEWCLREIKQFFKIAEQTGGLHIDDKSRIFKVIKTPVPLEKQPLEIQDLLGYEFFQIEKTTGRPREFNIEIDAKANLSFWAKLEDLAYDIYLLLVELKNRKNILSGRKDSRSDIGIYLAETTFDLRDVRDNIKRELQQRGYRVLPDQPLPWNAADFQAVVREQLQRAKLSVHLVGENYGFIPEAESHSHVFLQNELASERSNDPSFSRLIWMPVELKACEERQQSFIEFLHNDPAVQQGAELLQTSIEDLKTIIEDKLNNANQLLPYATAENDLLQIYLICDQQDYDSVRVLGDYLYDCGYELVLPAFEGDEAQLREDHKENLLLSDAVVIFYGKASELWMRAKLRDLKKVAGYGRIKPMLAKAIYMSGPETSQKQYFRTHEATLIKNFNSFSPDSLKPFLAELEKANGGRKQ